MSAARVFALAILLLLPPLQAAAFEKLDGWFIAFETCEALQSKNKGTNPGDVMTEVRRAYEIIGINKKGGDFYQMRLPGAPVTEERWVHAGCGVHVVAAASAPPGTPTPGPVEPAPGSEADEHVLALSWQPAFCETQAAQDRVPKPERGRAAGDGDAALDSRAVAAAERQLYCGVPTRWCAWTRPTNGRALPEVESSGDARNARGRHARYARVSWNATNGSSTAPVIAARVGRRVL